MCVCARVAPSDGPEGKAILEKKLGEQQGMMAKLEAMKESAAKQKIMLQLKGVSNYHRPRVTARFRTCKGRADCSTVRSAY